MGAEEGRTTLHRLYDAFNRHDLEAMGDCLDDGFVSHYTGTQGRDDFLRFMQGFFEAFPDLSADVLDVVSDGALVANRIRNAGTHQGEFAGIPATGKPVELEASDFWRLNGDGRFTEHWGHADNLSMMQQLGVIPE